MKKPVSSDIYTKEYFLSDCNGYKEYKETKGMTINNRLGGVMQISSLKRGMTVLDIGCGRGEIAYQAALLGCKVVAIDYSSAAIKFTKETINSLPKKFKKNVVVKKIDAKMFVLPVNTFDRIIMADFVEHLHDWELKKVFLNCQKMLKNDGRVVIHTSPNKWYILYAYPILRILSILIGKDLGPVRKNYPDEKEHVNEHTPLHLKRILSVYFETKVWCENLHKAVWLNDIPLINNFGISVFAIAKPYKDTAFK